MFARVTIKWIEVREARATVDLGAQTLAEYTASVNLQELGFENEPNILWPEVISIEWENKGSAAFPRLAAMSQTV